MTDDERLKIRVRVGDVAALPAHLSRQRALEVRLFSEDDPHPVRGFILSHDDAGFVLERADRSTVMIVYSAVGALTVLAPMATVRGLGSLATR